MLLKADGVGENESVTNNNIPEVKGIMNDSSDEVDDDEDWGEEEFQKYLKEVFMILTVESGKELLSLDKFLTWEGN